MAFYLTVNITSYRGRIMYIAGNNYNVDVFRPL